MNTVWGWERRAGTLKSQKGSVEGPLPVIRLVLFMLLSVIFLTFILLTVQFRPPYLPSTIVSLLVSISALALLHWILTTARVKCAKKANLNLPLPCSRYRKDFSLL